jgi:hypothetical protein
MINMGEITPIGTRLIRGKLLCDNCISVESPSLGCKLGVGGGGEVAGKCFLFLRLYAAGSKILALCSYLCRFKDCYLERGKPVLCYAVGAQSATY